MSSLKVSLPGGSYEIAIEEGILDRAGQEIKKKSNAKKIFIITDENVYALYGETLRMSLKEAGFGIGIHVLKPGERSKSMKNLERILGAMARAGITRTDAVAALGGGVVGDIAGFASAVYMRGIPCFQIPTTLLAQIDSSVGGKTGVDLPEGKNLAGAFHQPKAVLIDPVVLKSLGKREFRDGMAEMVKYACIADREMFDTLFSDSLDMEKLISACCEIKKKVVEEDEFDTGLRMILNFGHTLGHAVEASAGYRRTHGQAVAAGMAHITRKSEEMGLTENGTAGKLAKLLKKYGLPVALPKGREQAVKEAVSKDKKQLSGKLNLVLLKEIGSCYIYPVGMDEIEKFL
jgi:3-dehydroquinate synthase